MSIGEAMDELKRRVSAVPGPLMQVVVSEEAIAAAPADLDLEHASDMELLAYIFREQRGRS